MTVLGRQTSTVPTEVARAPVQIRMMRYISNGRGRAAPECFGMPVRTLAILRRLVPRLRFLYMDNRG